MATKKDQKDGASLMMGGVRILFPYKSPYTAQKQIMSKVIHALKHGQNALLESPTGSGKSLAILCGVLAWHKQNYPKRLNLPTKPISSAENETKTSLKLKPKAPKIIFTSRTHTQLEQLIAEYRRTNYFEHFQMTVLGSRKSLCINQKIKPLFDRNEQCKKALDNRDCRYYRNKSYADRFKTNSKFLAGCAYDIEDLVSEGIKMGCCPFFGTRSLLERAELIFCPYNYILDPVIRTQMKINIKDAIVVIDEAHNVEDVCRSALTKSYTLQDLTAAIEELHKFKKLREDITEAMSEIKELITLIRDWMKAIDDELTTNDYKCHRNVYPHPARGTDKLRDILKKEWQYDTQNSVQYAEYARVIFTYFQEKKKEKNEEELKKIQKLSPKTSVIIEYLALILLPRILEFEIDFNIALLPVNKFDTKQRQRIKVTYLHFWCLSPSVAFKQIGEETHSVILTSGTLSPLEAMAYELKCSFDVQLVADHVIEKGQIVVTAIENGINRNKLKSNYSNLQKVEYQDDLGFSLLHLMKHIPQGIVVFFPSYATMQNLVDRWIQKGINKQMMDVKNIYIEPKGSDEDATKQFMEAIETFGRNCGSIKYLNKYKRSKAYKREIKKQKEEEEKAKAKKKGSITKFLVPICKTQKDENEDIDLTNGVKAPKGATFFGVCRGKISEGIDFSDGMSRAVILIGIPFANQKDPQIHFKKNYNDKEAQKRKAEYHAAESQQNVKQKNMQFVLDGNKWYSQQAFRALNQALGRCIRHKYDYGVIIFLESRFYGTSQYSKGNVSQLSKWIKPYMRSCLTVQQAVDELIKPYFEYMAKDPPKIGIKWHSPFNMPQNAWSKVGYNSNYNMQNNRFYTQNTNSNNNISNHTINNNNNKRSLTQNAGFSNGYNNNNNNNCNTRQRKRKYNECQNENNNSMNTGKRMKLDSNPNCAQCTCSAMICRGTFKRVELDRGGGQTQLFFASKQNFPCETSKDCLWSSQLGLTFMYKRCAECNISIGFHVVGAMHQNRLEYVGHILFLPKAVKLLTIR